MEGLRVAFDLGIAAANDVEVTTPLFASDLEPVGILVRLYNKSVGKRQENTTKWRPQSINDVTTCANTNDTSGMSAGNGSFYWCTRKG